MFAKLLGRATPHAPQTAPSFEEYKPGPPRPVPPGRIDFPAIGLHKYDGCYAVVLDSLFSREELSAFLAQAEASGPWETAQVNAGAHAYTNTSYRNGERLIYDSFDLSEKIFEKVRPHLSEIAEIEQPTYLNGVDKAVQKWRMAVFSDNTAMACILSGTETKQRTFYTLQFYLPSDASGSEESFVPAQGGTTRFLAGRSRPDVYADVEAIPGRILVFQHAELLHTGEEVTGGVKCAVRSDILYERVGPPIPVPAAR